MSNEHVDNEIPEGISFPITDPSIIEKLDSLTPEEMERFAAALRESLQELRREKVAASAPDTKYRAGQIVNVVMPEVWIKKVQFAGGGADAHQYVGQTKNGVEIFFTDDHVMKVIGEVD